MMLQGVSPLDEPDVALEQYQTPAGMAAEILYGAYMEGHIAGRNVLDLGCGSGIFSLGSAWLGAAHVTGVDVDPKALAKLRANITGTKTPEIIELFQTGVADFQPGRTYDTCVMNPPFGAQMQHADRPFLARAMELSRVIYTLHMTDTADFIRRFVRARSGRVAYTADYRFPIPHMFFFHTRPVADVPVTCFKIECSDA